MTAPIVLGARIRAQRARLTLSALLAVFALILGATGAGASDVDVAVVDVTTPIGSVSVVPGGPSVPITINMTVQGNQVGTATFSVLRDWTLSGGTFTGTNPRTFTVAPRSGNDPATTFTTSGTVTVHHLQAAGAFDLSVAAFGITNDNTNGGKLAPGKSTTYRVNVTGAPTDATPPTITVPSGLTLEATGPAGAVATYTATANDAVDGPRPVTCSPASATTFPIGQTTVTCSATDAKGNTGTGSFVVTVVDSSAPTLSLPDDITAEATGPAGAVVTYVATASDLADSSVTPSCSPPPGSTFALGATTVSCTVTDDAGNTSSDSFTVTVADTTAPVLTLPTAMTVEASGPNGASVSFTPTAADAVDENVSVTCSPSAGSMFALGDTTVTCSATDDAGNKSTGSFVVTVGDTTEPTLYLPAHITAEATGPSGAAVTFSATATDLVSGDLAVTCAPPSGTTFALTTTTVNCSATDAAGNAAADSFSVTVEDTTAPVLTLPSAITAEATGPAGATVTYAASASDLVDGTVAVTCSPASGTTMALGTTSVHCSATDKAGNTATGSFTVTVEDTTAPTLIVPANLTVEATGPTGAVLTYLVSASDLVDGAITPACSPPSESNFGLGESTVACSARDLAGNTTSDSFVVTVRDTTAPAVTVPADFTATATASSGAVVTYTATARDLVDGTVIPTCVPASGSTFAPGVTTVTCQATDLRGNTSPGVTFKVHVTYPWSGFRQPINLDGSSVFKQGSTVPVKFGLTGTAASVTDAAAHLYVAKITNNVVGSDVEPVSTSAADTGNQFRYDAAGGQYIFNLNTKNLTAGSYQLRADLGDGVDHTVVISLKK